MVVFVAPWRQEQIDALTTQLQSLDSKGLVGEKWQGMSW